MKISNQSRWSV